jgi:hypothetical protein
MSDCEMGGEECEEELSFGMLSLEDPEEEEEVRAALRERVARAVRQTFPWASFLRCARPCVQWCVVCNILAHFDDFLYSPREDAWGHACDGWAKTAPLPLRPQRVCSEACWARWCDAMTHRAFPLALERMGILSTAVEDAIFLVA